MTTTDLALVAAILLLVLCCAAYVVLRVRRVARSARDREQRRAAALLAEVSASARPAPNTTPTAAAPAHGWSTNTDHDQLVAAVRDLADDLRRTADRVVAIAEDRTAPVPARSQAVVAAVGEATSAYALRRVSDVTGDGRP